MITKEKKLLKKYLDECNLDEEWAYTPGTSQRERLLENKQILVLSPNQKDSSDATTTRKQ